MKIEHDGGNQNMGSDRVVIRAMEIFQCPVLAKFLDGIVLNKPAFSVGLPYSQRAVPRQGGQVYVHRLRAFSFLLAFYIRYYHGAELSAAIGGVFQQFFELD